MSFSGTDDPAPLLLYSGRRGGKCESFEPHVGGPNVVLTGLGYSTECPPQIHVFARKSKAIGLVADPLQFGSEIWFTEALSSKSLSLALDPSIPLPVTFWLLADANDLAMAKSMRDRLAVKAYSVLDLRGTGVTLDTSSTVLASGSIPYDCNASEQIISKPESYDASRLNVYFVKYYLHTDVSPAYNCVADGHPEIIFISWGNENVQDPTLAHEIGHSLGLILPLLLYGHTFEEGTFTSGNFMASGGTITNVSIGQLYAMNFSSYSWINSALSPFKRPGARECQDSWSTGVCPALDRFVMPSGWPPP